MRPPRPLVPRPVPNPLTPTRPRRRAHRPRRRALLGALLALTCVALAAPAAEARTTVLYDVPDGVATVMGFGSTSLPTDPRLDPELDNVLQQGNAPVLIPGRLAGKISSRGGSQLTPSLLGLTGPALAQVLRKQVDFWPAHIEFVNEIGPGQIGAGAAPLAQAMRILSGQPAPWGGTYADHVHVYVRTIQAMVGNPSAWGPAWQALAASGGVWLEAYSGSTFPFHPWVPEQWLAWPRAFATAFSARGGRLDHLHFLMSGGVLPGEDQATVWTGARNGTDPLSSCAILQNGPGAYRLSAAPGSARDFAAQYRLSFPNPAVEGQAPLCSSSPVLSDGLARALADPSLPGILTLEHLGVTLPVGGLSAQQIPINAVTTLTVRLPGPDLLGILGRLTTAGAPGPLDPAAFWAAANPRVIASGAQVSGASVAPFVQQPDGSWQASVPLLPKRVGPITLQFRLESPSIRAALGPPADLSLSLAPQLAADPALEPTLRRVLTNPLDWKLQVPLGGAPGTAALWAINPAPVIAGLSRTAAPASRKPLTVSVRGAGFVRGSVVTWNGRRLPTTLVKDSALTARVPAPLPAKQGQASLAVVTPAPGGGTSNAAGFRITPPPPPRAVRRPRVVGRAVPGASLRCVPGRWSPAADTYAYVWRRDGRPLGGASSPRRRVGRSDVGRRIQCLVIATSLGAKGRAASSPVRVRPAR